MGILADKMDSVLNGLWDFLHAQSSFHYNDFIQVDKFRQVECKSECNTVGILSTFFDK